MSDAATETTAGPPPQKAFGRTYWLLNSIEAFERLAYFGIRAVVPLYIMQATEPGGLHLTAMHKGTIYAWWAVFQSYLPIVTGGIADRYGYKKILAMAVAMNVAGYVIMANFHSYWGFFAGVLVLATGTAFFKPSLQGSLAQSLNKANSSLGWGIFYWVVNVGAFAAPFMSTAVLGKPHSLEGWQNLFYLCAGFTSLNLLLLLTFKDVPSGASKSAGIFEVLKTTIANIFETRLLIWLAIMSCFWLMMYQLWDLHPNFITDWVDSSELAAHVPMDAFWEYGDRGLKQVPQQILLNLNAGLIILLMVPLSWLSSKMRTLSAMLVGMSVATCGVLVSGLTGNGWFLLLGIAFFSLGEMWTGPKKNEYLGLIAPPGKKALYLGYVNIPVGVGVFIGSYMAGYVYDNYGEKATLALKELGKTPAMVAAAAPSIDWSDQLDKLPQILNVKRDLAFETLQADLALDAEQTAQKLRLTYAHDAGQMKNLGLVHIASNQEFAEKTQTALAEELRGRSLAAMVEELPKATGVGRAEVWGVLRTLEGKSDTEIAASLWHTYGADPDVLDNLALEYLAQGTGRLEIAVAKMTFADPVTDIPKQAGIDRTRAFTALSALRGVPVAELDERLNRTSSDASKAVFVYLMQQPHLLFAMVAHHPWTHDIGFLQALLDSSPQAVAAARDKAGKDLSPQEMAESLTVIQAALSAIDWVQHADAAAKIIGKNVFEARALAAADMNQSQLKTTQMLWEDYKPHLHVWIPFGIIGILATIALGIFGQMAKRWKDMNA